MYDKILAGGFECLPEHELLEVLLYYAYKRIDTNEIAHDMINAYGSLQNVFRADMEELISVKKLSKRIAVLIGLIPYIAKTYIDKFDANDVVSFSNAEDSGRYAVSLFIGKTKEEFYVISLTTTNRFINATKIAVGTVNEAIVSTRKVVEAAIINQATAVILAHNHPGGRLIPSKNDMDTTMEIIRAFKPLGITVHDHIIVSGYNYYSFKAHKKI